MEAWQWFVNMATVKSWSQPYFQQWIQQHPVTAGKQDRRHAFTNGSPPGLFRSLASRVHQARLKCINPDNDIIATTGCGRQFAKDSGGSLFTGRFVQRPEPFGGPACRSFVIGKLSGAHGLGSVVVWVLYCVVMLCTLLSPPLVWVSCWLMRCAVVGSWWLWRAGPSLSALMCCVWCTAKPGPRSHPARASCHNAYVVTNPVVKSVWVS